MYINLEKRGYTKYNKTQSTNGILSKTKSPFQNLI